MNRVFYALAAISMAATPAVAADFSRETWCEGEVVFPDDNGLAEIYELRIWLHKGRYSVVANDRISGEVTADEGECDLTRDRICKHVIPGDEVAPEDAYAFMLVPMQAGKYLYKEIWLDGSEGRGLVTCYTAL